MLWLLEARRLRGLSTQEVFTDIFHRNYWGAGTSSSGTGSEASQVHVLVEEIPRLLRALHVTSLLDIPCGDFRWMKDVDLEGITYIGADIVPDLIAQNQARFGGSGRMFVSLNLLRDPLPRMDLILCRDCLVHFSLADARAALRNISMSGARYFLATTFPTRRSNPDIVTGQWRPVNLELAPFDLPPPLRLLSEQCTEEEGAYGDKSLGLWDLAQVMFDGGARPP